MTRIPNLAPKCLPKWAQEFWIVESGCAEPKIPPAPSEFRKNARNGSPEVRFGRFIMENLQRDARNPNPGSKRAVPWPRISIFGFFFPSLSQWALRCPSDWQSIGHSPVAAASAGAPPVAGAPLGGESPPVAGASLGGESPPAPGASLGTLIQEALLPADMVEEASKQTRRRELSWT